MTKYCNSDLNNFLHDLLTTWWMFFHFKCCNKFSSLRWFTEGNSFWSVCKWVVCIHRWKTLTTRASKSYFKNMQSNVIYQYSISFCFEAFFGSLRAKRLSCIMNFQFAFARIAQGIAELYPIIFFSPTRWKANSEDDGSRSLTRFKEAKLVQTFLLYQVVKTVIKIIARENIKML